MTFRFPAFLAFILGLQFIFLTSGLKAQEGGTIDPSTQQDQISAEIPVEEWFTHPWTPMPEKEMLFDLNGALIIKGLTKQAEVNPTAYEAAAFLRLEPRFQITSSIGIFGRFDIAGGLGFGAAQEEQLGFHPATQFSIGVARLWMEVGLFHQRAIIAAGRMPRHLGLGIWQNNGSGAEATHGQGLDQIQVILKLGSILLLPSLDFISSEPTLYYYAGQPLDMDNVDDAFGLTLTLALIDSPEDLAEQIKQGLLAWNFSATVFYRQQARLWAKVKEQEQLIQTDGRQAGLDIWLGIYKNYFRWEFESLFYWHRFKTLQYGQVSGVPFALATELAWWPQALPNHNLGFKFKAGLASGDRDPGFASLNDNISQAAGDNHIQSFTFHPDYLVDRILFRRLLGTVSESYYLRPEIDYLIYPQLLASLAFIYSSSVYASSTPGGKAPLGAEFDLAFSWHTKGMLGIAGLEEHERFYEAKDKNNFFNGLEIVLDYNLLVPLSGLAPLVSKPVHLVELRLMVAF